jgi:hypothetical protein
MGRIKQPLLAYPALAGAGHVLSLLLGSVQDFMDGPPLSIGRRLRLGAKERTDGQRTDCRDWDRPGQEQL